MTPTLRSQFPLLQRQINGKLLVYLDTAATAQKPQAVIDAIVGYYQQHNANIHRGVHALSDESTALWHESRATIAHFFGATEDELIVTRNTTEAINGVAYGWADVHLQAGDTILISLMDHHSNLVCWQEAARRAGARVEFIELTPEGRLNLIDLKKKLTPTVKLVALPWVSNTLGTINPVAEIVQLVKQHSSARVLVDAAQAAPHLKINFDSSGVDFLAMSGHKLYGPMGVGVLLVRKELLSSNEMRPWLFGGGMIDEVHQQHASFHPDPRDRFTAGTPDVASVVGLAAAVDFLQKIGMQTVEQHSRQLVAFALEKLHDVSELTIVGPTVALPGAELDRVGSVAFTYEGVHAHDVAQVLDAEGIAVRSGHHCTMPLHEHFGWQATVRASFGVYTTQADIDSLVAALASVARVFGKK